MNLCFLQVKSIMLVPPLLLHFTYSTYGLPFNWAGLVVVEVLPISSLLNTCTICDVIYLHNKYFSSPILPNKRCQFGVAAPSDRFFLYGQFNLTLLRTYRRGGSLELTLKLHLLFKCNILFARQTQTQIKCKYFDQSCKSLICLYFACMT